MKILDTDRLILRAIELDDARRIEELAGDYDVAKSTLNIPHPYPKRAGRMVNARYISTIYLAIFFQLPL